MAESGSMEKAREEMRRKTIEMLDRHLAEKGLRWTKQRTTILDAFLAAHAHVSVDELCETLKRLNPEIGPATVYRCMNMFVEAGVAKERRFNEGRVRFEPAAEVEHHDHFICTQCGAIHEFEDPRIERLQDEIARARGFEVRQHRLELYGLCPECLKTAGAAGKKPDAAV